MSLKHIVSIETAKKLSAAGLKNENPEFGDIFYVIHPDTKQIDNVVVGSAKWHICAMLEMHFAPTATNLLQRMGERYRLLCVGGKNWIVEKEIDTRFDDKEYEYTTESYPIANSGNPAEALAEVFLSNL